MTDREGDSDHPFSEGEGFGDDYDEFDLDPPELGVDPSKVDPVDSRVVTDTLDQHNVGSDDVDAAEIAAYSPTLEMTSYEAIGLCAEGESSSLIEDGVTAPNGSFPVNLSGGPLATSPPNAGGIYRAIAASQVIEGDLGDGSAERVLLADNDMHLGEPGRTDAVMVLEGGAA